MPEGLKIGGAKIVGELAKKSTEISKKTPEIIGKSIDRIKLAGEDVKTTRGFEIPKSPKPPEEPKTTEPTKPQPQNLPTTPSPEKNKARSSTGTSETGSVVTFDTLKQAGQRRVGQQTEETPNLPTTPSPETSQESTQVENNNVPANQPEQRDKEQNRKDEINRRRLEILDQMQREWLDSNEQHLRNKYGQNVDLLNSHEYKEWYFNHRDPDNAPSMIAGRQAETEFEQPKVVQKPKAKPEPAKQETPQQASKPKAETNTDPAITEEKVTEPVPKPVQTIQTEQKEQANLEETRETALDSIEGAGKSDSEESRVRIENFMRTQVNDLKEAMSQGSEVKEKIRKGIFDPKVVLVLRMINILVENPTITKILNLDSQVADIKELWGDYQDMKDKTKTKRRNPDSLQATQVAMGERADSGSESKEVNFEDSNIRFLKEKTEEFLQMLIQETGVGKDINIEDIRAQINDEIDSLVDAGREVDFRKYSVSKPQLLSRIKSHVQSLAKGTISKQSFGIKILGAIKS